MEVREKEDMSGFGYRSDIKIVGLVFFIAFVDSIRLIL